MIETKFDANAGLKNTMPESQQKMSNGVKIFLGVGAILDGLLIAATHYMGWPGELNYVWAALAIIWGFLIFKSK